MKMINYVLNYEKKGKKKLKLMNNMEMGLGKCTFMRPA